MSSNQKIVIPPKDEWRTLSISQLYELKTNLTNRYFDLKQINASFADQFLSFLREAEALLSAREREAYEQQQSPPEDS